MSMAFFLKQHDDAIVWRAPLKHSLLQQFLGKVTWGCLDYLIVDLPPGTGDEALSIVHLLRSVDGAVIVTTPQDVALLDARESVTFCKEINIPLLGVVENMSGLTCPHCNNEIDLFKTGGGERIAREMNLHFLGRIPLDPEMVTSADNGSPLISHAPESPCADAFKGVADRWKELLDRKQQG